MLRSMKYGLYAAALAAVVGGTVAWTAVDKNVTVVVDGQARTIHTTAGTVAGALSGAGYSVGDHDIVAPAASSSLHADETVVYKRGRLLRLDINGTRLNVWTTATTVQQALAQLGYSGQDAVSVSRATRLPLTPTSLAIDTAKTITLVRKSGSSTITTTVTTVAALLAKLDLSPDTTWTSLPGPTALEPGMSLQLKAMTKSSSTETVAVPFQTTSQQNASLPKGVTEISTPGQPGSAQVTYALVYLDGELFSKVPVSQVQIAAPVNQVQTIGTSDVPVTTPAGAMAYAASQLSNFGWGQDQMSCLIQMWGHESGWRVNAANPSGAYGIPQALPGSKMGPGWQSDPTVQIKWGLGYIKARYVSPCGAWSFWQAHSYY